MDQKPQKDKDTEIQTKPATDKANPVVEPRTLGMIVGTPPVGRR